MNSIMPTKKIACIVPTYNGEKTIEKLINSLEIQDVDFDLYIVDSSSSDNTIDLLAGKYTELFSIPTKEFDHGSTRQYVVDTKPGYDFYVFMTQDAYLSGKDSLRKLMSPFKESCVGAVCGRQIPHLDANLFAQHARIFNYPNISQIKTIQDASVLGIKTAFISNSFAAYRKDALSASGGFPGGIIFAEDMFVAAKMLTLGWNIAYAADAICFHSHNYTITQEFKRYFDMGVFHNKEPWIRHKFGGAGGEGLKFVTSELKFLGWRNGWLYPFCIFRNFIKLTAFKFGLNSKYLPLSIIKKLSMNKYYWEKNS